MSDVQWRDIYGLYAEGWGERMVAEAMSHPAKVRPAVAREIFRYGIERGFWPRGSTLVDPFGGVGGFLLTGGWAGLRVIGCEIEERFVKLCEANILLHAGVWDASHPRPVILHGDSRRLAEIVGAAGGAVTSPPYAEQAVSPQGSGPDQTWNDAYRSGDKAAMRAALSAERKRAGYTLGRSTAGVVSSPPYVETVEGGKRHGPQGAAFANRVGCGEASSQDGYGNTPGQLGALRPGSVEGLASSPPFETSDNRKPGPCLAQSCEAHGVGTSHAKQDVELSSDNLGNERGTTFWEAARDIVAQCHAVLRPCAMTAWVCKDFVRAKQRVPFCDDWCRLLELAGFRVTERWRMWQRSKGDQHDIFGGKAPCKESKGFFRRLAESKGSPRIDFEECIWAERLFAPAEGESQ